MLLSPCLFLHISPRSLNNTPRINFALTLHLPPHEEIVAMNGCVRCSRYSIALLDRRGTCSSSEADCGFSAASIDLSSSMARHARKKTSLWQYCKSLTTQHKLELPTPGRFLHHVRYRDAASSIRSQELIVPSDGFDFFLSQTRVSVSM